MLRLLTYRPRWGLTLTGWLALLAVTIGVTLGVGSRVHRFLNLTARTPARVLVVEGWIHDHALAAAADEFRSGGYREVYTTGGPLQTFAGGCADIPTAAELGAIRLERAGLPADRVHPAPAAFTPRDRTYASAVALRAVLDARGTAVEQLNIVTADVHARRTRLLFQRAFGPQVTIGVIGVPNPNYDARHWWRSSEGVRDVLGESIAYVYARFFFSAPPPPVRST